MTESFDCPTGHMTEWERLTMMAARPEMWAASYESFVTQVAMCLTRLELDHDEVRIFLADWLGKGMTGSGRARPVTVESAQKVVVAAEHLLKHHGKEPGPGIGSVEYGREVERLFQRLWTKAVDTEGYNKVEWSRMHGYLLDLLKRAGTPTGWAE